MDQLKSMVLHSIRMFGAHNYSSYYYNIDLIFVSGKFKFIVFPFVPKSSVNGMEVLGLTKARK